jgi:hypothetical protein
MCCTSQTLSSNVKRNGWMIELEIIGRHQFGIKSWFHHIFPKEAQWFSQFPAVKDEHWSTHWTHRKESDARFWYC